MKGGHNKIGNEIMGNLDTLLKDCDYICNVLPKTPLTDGILGNGRLELCKGNIYI